ncbi:MAG: GNAT family N-acetyltransferase [Acidobacteriaceae bacterium]
MLLRGYRATDLDALHALDVVCFERPFRFSRGAMRRFAEAKDARVILAEENDSLAGFLIFHLDGTDRERMGYIDTLDVSPEFRRRGIAKLLMREAERQALAEGCAALVLHVFTGNEPAIQFYTSNDFVRSNREEAFYGHDMDAWVFHKVLSSPGG